MVGEDEERELDGPAQALAVLERPEESVLVVAHSLPIRYVLNAAAGTVPVPKIEQVPYATPLRLGAAELEAAVERLAAWISEPVWPAPDRVM